MIRICFVCLGNICRSPTAEGVMQALVASLGLEHHVELDSAGTAAYHSGEAPDRRSQTAAQQRGLQLTGRARGFERNDWEHFDYVIAMDQSNYADLEGTAPSAILRQRLHRLRDFDANSPPESSIPDPYYGGESGFDEVLDLCEAACHGLLEHVRSRHHF